MAVSAPAGRVSGGSTTAHEGFGLPRAKAAPGPPLATCRECGVAVRFIKGFAPVLVGWRDGLCPACRVRAARERAMKMSRDEQREAILEELRRDPDATVEELVRRTGSTLARKVRKEAVGQGFATPATEVAARRRQERERSQREAKRRGTGPTGETVKGVIGADSGCGVDALAAKLGVSSTTIRRRLRALVAAGEIEPVRVGGGGVSTTYRVKS